MTEFFAGSGVVAWLIVALVLWVMYVDDYVRIRLLPRAVNFSVFGWGFCVVKIHRDWKDQEGGGLVGVNLHGVKWVEVSGWLLAAGRVGKAMERI